MFTVMRRVAAGIPSAWYVPPPSQNRTRSATLGASDFRAPMPSSSLAKLVGIRSDFSLVDLISFDNGSALIIYLCEISNFLDGAFPMASETLTKVTRNGQITLPAPARHALHVEEGDYVQVHVTEDSIVLTPKK
ncbi:MAG: AbrB/MazE/SpoVT family DNA-binding domain-containing protein, partial [bacterium]|nr:AbrB/MazE/SpoVT family DNA-binding domain-containing protein [bacterium]